MTEKTDRHTATHWNRYWVGHGDDRNEAVTGDAPGDLFNDYWQEFLTFTVVGRERVRFADVACGAGVVLNRALAIVQDIDGLFLGIDYAESAARQVNKRRPMTVSKHDVVGIAASALELPVASGQIDIITSQFGIEYAGVDAFREAARVLAPGGHGAFIIHHRNGGIFAECMENLNVLRAIISQDLFAVAGEFIRAPERPNFVRLSEGLAAIKAVAANTPDRSASLLAGRLARDIGRIAARPQSFELNALTRWIDTMEDEVFQYAERMSAMTDCAMSEAQFNRARIILEAAGLQIDEASPITVKDRPLPAAWSLRCRRP